MERNPQENHEDCLFKPARFESFNANFLICNWWDALQKKFRRVAYCFYYALAILSLYVSVGYSLLLVSLHSSYTSILLDP